MNSVFSTRTTALLIVMIAGLSQAHAQTDKSSFTLMNPTPRDQMRELTTDRPDKTESPYTVDAGHFQIETDLVNYTEDKIDEAGIQTKTKSLSALVSNLKVGLTNSIDMQVVIAPYVTEKTTVTGLDDENKTGIGDTLLRVKFNFFGNDGGDIAMGLMPFVKFPTNTDDLGNDKIEGGLILPIALSLPHDLGLGLMAQVNRSKNETNDEFHTEYVSSMSLSSDLAGELGGYVEFFSQSSDEDGAAWVATFDTGVTYGVSKDLQLDAGVNLGLTKAADDVNPFIGISARF